MNSETWENSFDDPPHPHQVKKRLVDYETRIGTLELKALRQKEIISLLLPAVGLLLNDYNQRQSEKESMPIRLTPNNARE